MQDWLPASLTTATTFKSQKILFKARALGSNLLQPKGDYVHLTSQYYSASIETRPPQLHNLLCFSAVLPPLTFYGPPPLATRGSAIYVFLVIFLIKPIENVFASIELQK